MVHGEWRTFSHQWQIKSLWNCSKYHLHPLCPEVASSFSLFQNVLINYMSRLNVELKVSKTHKTCILLIIIKKPLFVFLSLVQKLFHEWWKLISLHKYGHAKLSPKSNPPFWGFVRVYMVIRLGGRDIESENYQMFSMHKAKHRMLFSFNTGEVI
jgi:hypothetical protein